EEIGRTLLRYGQVVPKLVDALAGALFDAPRQGQECECAADRKRNAENRQSGPHRAAAQVANGEPGKVHERSPSGSAVTATARSSIILPSFTLMQRGQRRASASSWVTSTSATPPIRCSPI